MEISFQQHSFGVPEIRETGYESGKADLGKRKSQVSKGEIEERIRRLREEIREGEQDLVSLPRESVESCYANFKKLDAEQTSASPREQGRPEKRGNPRIRKLGLLLSTVKQQRIDHQVEENRTWETDFRAKERRIESLISEGKSAYQRQSSVPSLSLSIPVLQSSSRVSLDTPTMKDGLRMMSRWPTVATLASSQAWEQQISSSGSLLSTLQRELRMAQFRADASDREVINLKLGQEETERKLTLMQMELEEMKRKSVTGWRKRDRNVPEINEFGSEERLASMSSFGLETDQVSESQAFTQPRPPPPTHFQGLFSLRKQRISAQIRAFSARHRLWMDDLKSILAPKLR